MSFLIGDGDGERGPFVFEEVRFVLVETEVFLLVKLETSLARWTNPYCLRVPLKAERLVLDSSRESSNCGEAMIHKDGLNRLQENCCTPSDGLSNVGGCQSQFAVNMIYHRYSYVLIIVINRVEY